LRSRAIAAYRGHASEIEAQPGSRGSRPALQDAIGFFLGVAIGFVVYAALTVCAVIRLKAQLVAPGLAPRASKDFKGESPYASIPTARFAGR
jgi:hypothetical protein